MSESGFVAFKAAIDDVSAQLGGHEHVRTAVAHEFYEELVGIIEHRLGVARHCLPMAVDWTLAEDGDFHAAVDRARDVVGRVRSNHPGDASAQWRGASLVQRGLHVWLEGGQSALLVAIASDRGAAYSTGDSDGGREDWSVFVTDAGLTAITGSRYGGSSRPTSTHARSQKGAEKSLRSIVERFFETKLEKVAAPEPGPKGKDPQP